MGSLSGLGGATKRRDSLTQTTTETVGQWYEFARFHLPGASYRIGLELRLEEGTMGAWLNDALRAEEQERTVDNVQSGASSSACCVAPHLKWSSQSKEGRPSCGEDF